MGPHAWMKASSSSSNTSGVASRDPASGPGTDVDCDISSSDPTAVCLCTRTRFKPFCFWSSGQRVRTNEDDLNCHHVRPSLLRLGSFWHHLHDVYGILMVDGHQKGSACPLTSHTSSLHCSACVSSRLLLGALRFKPPCLVISFWNLVQQGLPLACELPPTASSIAASGPMSVSVVDVL